MMMMIIFFFKKKKKWEFTKPNISAKDGLIALKRSQNNNKDEEQVNKKRSCSEKMSKVKGEKNILTITGNPDPKTTKIFISADVRERERRERGRGL